MNKNIPLALGAAAVFGLAVGFIYLIWLLWCWVMPQLFTSPESLVHPSFGLFLGAWVLFSLIGKALFGSRGG